MQKNILIKILLPLCLIVLFLPDLILFIKNGYYLLVRNNGTYIFLKFLFYVFLFVSSLIAVLLMFFSNTGYLRKTARIIFTPFITINWVVFFVNGEGITLHEVLLFFQEKTFWGNAFQFFIMYILLGFALTIGLIYCIVKLGRNINLSIKNKYVYLSLLSFPLSVYVTQHSECRIYQYPAPVKIAALTIYARLNMLPVYGERMKPFFYPGVKNNYDHIIFIMDESIRGDLLSVNNPFYDTTPFMLEKKDSVINLGVINSIANYSAASNLLLMSGLMPAKLPDKHYMSLKYPLIFNYMKNSGYKTYMIDNQFFGSYNNFLTKPDVEKLNRFIKLKEEYPEKKDWMLDTLAITKIKEIIKNEERTFFYLLKSGCHFPYKINSAPGVVPSSLRNKESLSVKEEYLQSVYWSVDSFWKKLWDTDIFKQKKVLIVYTSDHGQSFIEEGASADGHGSTISVPDEQYKIPFIVFTRNLEIIEKVKREFINQKIYSAFEIFPLILKTAGYRESEINKYYNPEGSLNKSISGDLFNRGGTFKWRQFK